MYMYIQGLIQDFFHTGERFGQGGSLGAPTLSVLIPSTCIHSHDTTLHVAHLSINVLKDTSPPDSRFLIAFALASSRAVTHLCLSTSFKDLR